MTAAAPSSIGALAAIHGDVHALPVSFAQRRFWVLDQLDEATAAYTIPVALELSGPLDVDAFRRAVAHIVARHESLRTVFVVEGDEPVQVVLPSLTIPIEVEELRAISAEARDDALRSATEANLNRGFDLATGPLMRMRLLRTADDTHVWLAAFHHIIADGVSIGIFFGELEQAYASLSRGGTLDGDPLALQYPDYAVWQRKSITGNAAARQVAYWKGALAELPTLELATDRPRPAIMTAAGGKRELAIPAELADGMRALARREGATPYAAFLAAFAALLHRYTAQEDLVIGSITAGRRRAEVEPLIGLFVNTLAIRADVSGDPSFAELLRRLRDRTLAALSNQDIPFEQVVDAVQPTRDRSRSPIFQAAFQLLDTVGRELQLAGITARRVPGAKDTSKFDLTLMLAAAPGGALRAVLEYRSDLFDVATVDRMLGHFAVLLAAAVRDPSQPVGALPLMAAAEWAHVVHDWNATAHAVPDASLHALILQQAARTPDAVAVEADREDGAPERLTFAELATRATVVARWLHAQGVRPGTGVGICIERSADLVVAIVGVLASGAYYVPLDPAYPADRVAYMLGQSGVGVLLTQRALADRLPIAASATRVIALDAEWDALVQDGDATCPIPAPVDADDLAYVIYTSGSTGRPKGVMIPHRAVVNYVRWMATQYPVGPGDAILQKAPASFDACIWEFFLPLVTGARLVLARPGGHQDPDYLADVVARTGITVLQLVPSQLQMMLEATSLSRCTSLTRIVCGGEALPADLLGRLAQLMPGVAITNLYGPTETTVYSTHWTLPLSGFDGTAPIGTPIFNTQVYIMDPRLQPLPVGVPGELIIGGRGVAKGYFAQPELTAEKFVPDAIGGMGTLYRTGDLARWRADGNLEYLGRRDHQVKLRGFRIELGEIESALASHPAVRAAVAIVREDVAGDKRLVAYVVCDGATPTVAELKARVKERLPEFMVPSAVLLLDALPMNANGKLDRKALPVPEGGAGSDTPYVAPRTALEAEVAAVWAAVLGREHVGALDDFFALGGHSLLAMRVVARLSQALAVRLTIGAMFEARTVAGLAALITARQQLARPAERALARRPAGGDAPLSFAQYPLWLFEQMEPGTATYNVPIVRRLRGPARLDALEASLQSVVAAHEALRTVIVERDGTPWQMVRPLLHVPLDVVELRDVPAGERDLAAARTIATWASTPFDLAAGPLLRAHAAIVGDGDLIVVLVLHHAICDGGSISVLLADWAAAYTQACRGEAPVVPRPAVSMLDYAAWERAEFSDERIEEGAAFWRNQLADASPSVELPTDRPRSATRWGPGGRVTASFPGTTIEGVRHLGRTHGASTFMVLLAAFQATLHRYSGQESIVVGSPLGRRDRPDLERLVGCLVSTVLLRADMGDDPSFGALLARVRDRAAGAFEHAVVPSDRVVQALRGAAEGSGAGLFDVLFVLQDGIGELDRFGELSVERMGTDLGVAKFDLSLMAVSLPDGLRLVLDYRTDLFDADSMADFLTHLGELLDHGCANPTLPLSRLNLLGAGERAAMLANGDGGRLDYDTDASLGDLVAAQAAATPDAIAVVAGTRRMSYRELEERSRALAALLIARGVSAEVRVAICASRRLELIVGMVAVLRAGGAYVPLDPAYPEERLRVILEDAQAPLLLTERAQAATLRRLLGSAGGVVPEIIELDDPQPRTSADLPPVHGRDLAYVIYTSGSTGRPKGVAIAHRSAVALLAWARSVFTDAQTARVVACTSICFDLSVFELFVPLTRGGTVILVDDALAVRDLDAAAAPTLLNTVPSAAQALLALDGIPASVRTINLAGEPLVQELVDRLHGLPHVDAVFDLYGPSEDTTYSTYARRSRGGRATIGRPITNTQAYVLDAFRQPLPRRVPGELFLGGDGLARGYLGQSGLTDERFVPNPFAGELGRSADDRLYRTGDRVRWLPDGTLEYLGRLDHQVKLRGFRIEMGEVESTLRRQPGVRQAVAMVRTDPMGERRLVAYVDRQPDGDAPQASALQIACAATLPVYMVPSAFVVLEALPLTPNGKVDRRALPAPAQFVSARAPQPPRTDVERVVAQIWTAVLGARVDSVEATFTEQGGHSLLATRVAAQVGKIFRSQLSLRQFFESPTVAGIARALSALEAKPGQAALIAATVLKVQQLSPEEREHLRRAGASTATPTGSVT